MVIANVKLIKTEADYEETLARIDEIFDAEPNTPEGDELELLSMLVEAYEQKNTFIPKPDPIEAIKFRMEQLGLKQVDLAKFVGGENRASEILNRKRSLTVEMIRILHEKLNIPLELLIS